MHGLNLFLFTLMRDFLLMSMGAGSDSQPAGLLRKRTRYISSPQVDCLIVSAGDKNRHMLLLFRCPTFILTGLLLDLSPGHYYFFPPFVFQPLTGIQQRRQLDLLLKVQLPVTNSKGNLKNIKIAIYWVRQ